MKAGIYELPDGTRERVYCDEASELEPFRSIRVNRNWLGRTGRVNVRLFDVVAALVEVRIFDVLDPDDRSEPMSEPVNPVRFCDKCGVRTTHSLSGDKCLVCELPKTPTPQETSDDRTSEQPSDPKA